MKAKKIKKLARQTWNGDPESEIKYQKTRKGIKLVNCFRAYYQQLKRSQK